LTPYVQRWLDKKGKDRSLTRTRQLRVEYERIKKFSDDPEEFTQYLIYAGLQITFISTFLGIFAGIFFLLGQLLNVNELPVGGFLGSFQIAQISFALGQAASLIGTLMIFNICRVAISTWRRVKNFEEYENTVVPKLRPVANPGQEEGRATE
jgi:hypothetical protein